MDRNYSSPSFNQRQKLNSAIHAQLPDNWKHLTLKKMTHSHSLPQVTNFNINEDDSDCPGHKCIGHLAWIGSAESLSSESSLLTRSCSSEGLYDGYEGDTESRDRSMSIDSKSESGDESPQSSSSQDIENSDEHYGSSRIRTMSIDDVLSEDENSNSNVVRFILPQADTDSDSEPEISTPIGNSHQLAPDGSFFKLERRASFDNGVFGMPDRIMHGDIGNSTWDRKVMTAPGTPADPSTPVPRYLSQDELLVEPEQVFNRIYNLLCAERVTQMTKTYNDIEAVTRLLEEKERDLELAARIGQTLLSKNKELTYRGDGLDEQLSHANEKIKQLKHDVAMKDELLRFYCQDLQDQSPDDGSPSPGPTHLSKFNLDLLQKKVYTLEEENLVLRLESAQLHSDTEAYEEKEKKLVEDCLEQLSEVNQQVETFAGELRVKTEESSRQKEEITALLAQVADLHKRVRQLTVENMDLAEKLQASQESQRQLTKQLTNHQDRYDELFEMLEEAQDELRGHRNRNNPKATRHLYASAALPQATAAMDSLASELQNSMQQEEDEKKERRVRRWKVFETARAARKAASKSSRDSSVRMSTSASEGQAASNINSDNESFNSDGYSADMDSMCGSSTELGRPGIPGSNDLESALRRLALRRANDLNERDFFLEAHRETRSGGMSPFRVSDTPDSMASPASGYSYLGTSSNNPSGAQFKMSDKLQIVKPLEGSVTLRHWQRLAQPHLGGLFERREGVKVKGERKLDLEGEVYTLSDFEEDEDVIECPSRRMVDSSMVYTFTNSVVSYPEEQSLQPSESCSGLPPMGSVTPCSQASVSKRRPSTNSTYTMSLGLAAILQDREAASSVTGSVLRPIASCPVISDTVTVSSTTDTLSSAAAKLAASNSVTNTGLFGKLINTGYSLLWNKTDSSVSSTPTTPSSSSTPPVVSSSREPSSAKSPSKFTATSSQVLTGGATDGVLGAIATFRKNGML